MATHEIPKTEWETYLTAFTEKHQGALVTIEDADPLSTPTVEAGGMIFVSISYKANGNEADAVVLTTTKKGSESTTTHRIPAPKAVFHKPGAGVLSSEVNADEVMEITSSEKPPVHLLTFRHP